MGQGGMSLGMCAGVRIEVGTVRLGVEGEELHLSH